MPANVDMTWKKSQIFKKVFKLLSRLDLLMYSLIKSSPNYKALVPNIYAQIQETSAIRITVCLCAIKIWLSSKTKSFSFLYYLSEGRGWWWGLALLFNYSYVFFQ